MNGPRLRLKPWLEQQLKSGAFPGVSWLDERDRVFQLPWKHAARHGWSIERDASLFREWAIHTGRYRPGRDKPDPKTWKANFRCALNSLQDVCELTERSNKRGTHAFRVYKMMPHTHTQRRRGVRLFGQHSSSKQTNNIWNQTGSMSTSGALTHHTHTSGPLTHHTHTSGALTHHTHTSGALTHSSGPLTHTSGTSGEAFNVTSTQGMWTPEDQEDSVYKLMDNLSSSEDQRRWMEHLNCDPESYGELLGPNYMRELCDWSIHQHTLMPY